MTLRIEEGRPYPMGATWDGGGVNFAVFSAHATKIEVCLFSPNGRRETARIALPERTAEIWHGYIPDLRPGALYGLRADGPYDPAAGHRFNPNKLLLDPYAKSIQGRVRWSDALMAHRGGPRGLQSRDTRDSAFAMPRCVVVDPSFHWGDDAPPRTPWRDTVIYEAHVKGLTVQNPAVPKPVRGSYLAVASDAMIAHYKKLGVTAVELLPVHEFIDDAFLIEKGLTNYWGYQSIGFFSPTNRYMLGDDIAEFQQMVHKLHRNGIEVILDVVYDHTGEGGSNGPSLCFRGLDNASYYRLMPDDKARYDDTTGCGNALDLTHPMVLRMVMDSLRYWVEVMHVDGFRFDLATTLAREATGFDRRGGFFDAILQDPVLNRVKLIAEPWDIGLGGYQVGAFPAPFAEWNDKARDDIRGFWRGDQGAVRALAGRLLGSAEQFDHSGRPATSSVNFVTAHDGFVLEDVVSYNHKHNEANGEGNRDGHDHNISDNMGVEGPTDDPAIVAARDRRKRAMLATMLLSQGVPMLLAGDEIGNSQTGNNNAYCQDNVIAWLNWSKQDEALTAFCARAIAFRHAHPALRQRKFLHGKSRHADGRPDVEWRTPSGETPTSEQWGDPAKRTLCLHVRGSAESVAEKAEGDEVFMVFNAGPDVAVAMPDAPRGKRWIRALDSADPNADPAPAAAVETVSEQAVAAYALG